VSQRHDDHEALLRRALHSAVDSVEPAGDGLERIQARLTTPYPLPVAWVMAGYSEVARRVRGWLQSISVWLQTVLGPRLELRRLARPATPDGRRRLVRAGLVAALVVATFTLAAGTSVLTPLLRHTFSLTSALAHTIEGSGPAGTGKPGASDHDGGLPPGGGAAAGAAHGTNKRGHPGSANCVSPTSVPATNSTHSSNPAASPGSPSPSQPASPGPATSPSPAASPSPATSPGAATSPSPATSPAPATSPSQGDG